MNNYRLDCPFCRTVMHAHSLQQLEIEHTFASFEVVMYFITGHWINGITYKPEFLQCPMCECVISPSIPKQGAAD